MKGSLSPLLRYRYSLTKSSGEVPLLNQLNISPPEAFNEETFDQIQRELVTRIHLQNSFNMEDVRLVAGVDLAYWEDGDRTLAVCCISVVDYTTHEIVETKSLQDEIKVPYIAGYLSFRELPLILDTIGQLENDPDLIHGIWGLPPMLRFTSTSLPSGSPKAISEFKTRTMRCQKVNQVNSRIL